MHARQDLCPRTTRNHQETLIIAQPFLKNTANIKKITGTSAVESLVQEIIFLAGCRMFSVGQKLFDKFD